MREQMRGLKFRKTYSLMILISLIAITLTTASAQ